MVDLVKPVDTAVSADYTPGFSDSLDRRFSYTASFEEKPYETKETRMKNTLTYGIPNTLIGGVSEIVASLPGLDKDDAAAFEETILPSGALADFRKHEEGYKLLGSLAALAIPITTIPRLMQSKKLFNILEKTIGASAAGHLTTSGVSIADRVKRIKNASHISAKNQFSAISKEVNPVLAGTLKKEYMGAVYDTLKIGLATDLATYGLLNESDMLFPENLSAAENAAMYLVPTFAVAGIAGAFTRRKLQYVANRIHATAGVRYRNIQNLPTAEMLSVVGDRGASVSMLAATSQIKSAEFVQAGGNAALQANLNAQKAATDYAIVQNVEKMAQDSVLPGLTQKHSISEAEKNTVIASLKDDYASLEGVSSIEKLEDGAAEVVVTKMKTVKTKLAKAMEETRAEISITTGAKQRDVLTSKFDDLVEQQKALEKTFPFVLNTDGSRQLLSEYKPSFSDKATGVLRHSEEDTLLKNLNSAHAGDVFKVKLKKEGVQAYAVKFSLPEKDTYAFVSDDLKIILPDEALGAQTLKDQKKIIEATQAQSHVMQSLLDVGKVYHYNSGQLGIKITENLTPKTKNLLDTWTSSSVNHPFRTGANEGFTSLDELYTANERVRQSLKEIAGPDGTIPLFRGEQKQAALNPRDDLVSMSSNPVTAKKFGDTLTLVHIDPEDVVAVVGGMGDEFEFIVRGNLKRVIGSEITNQVYKDLNFAGKTALQHVSRLAVEAWNPATAKQINVSASMHHTEIDMLFALKDKWGVKNPQALDKIKFNDTVRDWNDLEYLSATSKYREYAADMDKMLQAEKGILKLKPSQKTTHADIVKTLNLPNDGVFGADPMTQIFHGLYVQGVKELGEEIPSFIRLQKELSLSKNTKTELLGTSAPDVIKSMGNQYQPIKDARKPVLLFGKSAYENPYSVDDYWHKAVEQRATQMSRFDKAAERGDAPLLEIIRQEVIADPARLAVAKQVSTLIEGTQARRGAVEAGVQTMDAVNNQPIIQAIDSIQDQIGKQTQRYISTEVFKSEHTAVLQKLLSHGNKGDLLSFNVARHQLGQGWRGVNLEIVEGTARLKLEDHEFNRQLFAKLYPNETLPENLYLPQPKAKVDSAYAPLQISDLAAQSLANYNKMSQNALSHINELRGISGLSPIPRKLFHLPSKNLKDKEQMVLLNHATGEIDSVVTGNTAQQVRKNVEQEIIAAKKQGVELFSVTDADLANYHHMELELLHGADDYSTTFRQTGTSKGRSFGQVIEIGPEVVEAMNQSLVRQYTQISRITSAVMFEPELRAAELAMRSAGLSKSEIEKGLTIWSQWKNRALGLKSQNKHQFIGRAYGAVEDAYDTMLQKAWDVKVAALTGTAREAKQAQKSYNALGDAVPEYNPIEDAAEFIRTTMKVKAPHSMMKHMSQLNNMAGLTMLRMFEVGLGLVNLGTLPTLIPVVAKALARQKGQTLDEWKRANAAWSSTINEQTAIWNPYRTFTSGMHYMFSPAGRAALKKAGEKGNLKQEVVERMEDITAPSMGYTENMVRKGAKWTSFIVDRTEQLSRSISYLTFHNMGVKNLKLGDDAAHEFAHQMANRTIGDFRPNNKPRIFQGATGAPFGLFTTFAYNYLQRVFGYLEKGQFDVFFQQMGLQTAFFGAKSLPGFNQYVEHFTSNYDGTENMVDRLDRSVGSTATDALLFGGVGSLTGMASWTRTDIRLPGSNLMQASSIFDLAPAASMVERTYTGISETIKAATSASGLSSGRLSEIASRTFPIKAVRGYFDLAQGYRVDSRGQIIDEEIKGATEVFSRLSSVRTTRDQRLMEEFSRQKNTQLKQQSVRNDARQAMRSLFREGKLNAKTLNGVAKDYLRSGGEPGDFDNFLLTQAKYGLINKGFLKALSIASRPSKQNEFLRLMKVMADRDRLAPE